MPSLQIISSNLTLKKTVKSELKDKFVIFSNIDYKDALKNLTKNDIDLVIIDTLDEFNHADENFKKLIHTLKINSNKFSLLIIANPAHSQKKNLITMLEKEIIQDILWIQQGDPLFSLKSFAPIFSSFIIKNFNLLKERRMNLINSLLNKFSQESFQQQLQKNPGLKEKIKFFYFFLTGKSEAILKLRAELNNALEYQTILINDNKELDPDEIVHYLHFQRKSKNHPLTYLNISKIPPHLQERVIFGDDQPLLPGFYGTDYDTNSIFEKTGKGTLYIRNIEDATWSVQIKLLESLQNQFFYRNKVKVNIKCYSVFSSSNTLENLVEKGLFRQDFFTHLQSFIIKLPLLTHFISDVIEIVESYIQIYAQDRDKTFTISEDFKYLLLKQFQPQSYNELLEFINATISISNSNLNDKIFFLTMNTLQKATKMETVKAKKGQSIQKELFHENETLLDQEKKFPSSSLFSYIILNESDIDLDTLEREYIIITLHKHGNKIAETSRILGISRKTLYEKIKKYNISLLKRA